MCRRSGENVCIGALVYAQNGVTDSNAAHMRAEDGFNSLNEQSKRIRPAKGRKKLARICNFSDLSKLPPASSLKVVLLKLNAREHCRFPLEPLGMSGHP